MMMGALQAGGLPLLVDENRPADKHNIRGYFEYRPVLSLSQNNDWLLEHRGKAVKIVYRLLYEISPQVQARILFMNRDLHEVVASQQAMLGEDTSGYDWVALFTSEVARVHGWVKRQPNLSLLDVSHRGFLDDPLRESTRAAQFLGLPLDVAAMAASADPSLYRQRK